MVRALATKVLWHLRVKVNPAAKLRRGYWRLQGMKIGPGVDLGEILVSFAHKVEIGRGSKVEHHAYFHYDGYYTEGVAIAIGPHAFIGAGAEFNIAESIRIGADCLIAAGARFIDHNHGTARGAPMRTQQGPPPQPIVLGDDVWVGANAVVLQGVTIGTGAVVAAGSVVTKSIPAYEVWGGVPARKLRDR